MAIASDSNWALPLALATNLHIPYRIVLGGDELKLPERDINGRVIIVCSSINSPQTINAINQLKTLRRTKILLLDTIGTIFNSNNALYRGIVRDGTWSDEGPTNNRNLLVLTILTEHFKLALRRVHGVDLGDYQHISERLLKIRLDVDDDYGDEGEAGPDNDSDGNQRDDIVASGQTSNRSLREGTTGEHQESLQSLINSTNLTSSDCDLNYFLTDIDASNLDQLHDLAGSQSRCLETLDSYCDMAAVDATYLNLATNDNVSGDELLGNGSAVWNEGASAGIDRRKKNTEQLCALLSERYRNLVLMGEETSSSFNRSQSVTSSGRRLIFSANFYLYDYILAIEHDLRYQHPHHQHQYQFDFIVFDLKNISNHRTTIVWRPFLILRQDQLNRQKFSMHPVLPGYSDWMIEGTMESFWICGVLCWSVIAIVVLIIVSIIFASVVFSIAVR
ncbi:uncharacterized protein LOC115269684 [Aedes albopictus]|uniref:Uncharacterized protein n=1 Tax=Aedes albopictus TaxID=7160 RepID=A0ABM1XVS1_AEDAL